MLIVPSSRIVRSKPKRGRPRGDPTTTLNVNIKKAMRTALQRYSDDIGISAAEFTRLAISSFFGFDPRIDRIEKTPVKNGDCEACDGTGWCLIGDKPV